jgi:hypothetical protein
MGAGHAGAVDEAAAFLRKIQEKRNIPGVGPG